MVDKVRNENDPGVFSKPQEEDEGAMLFTAAGPLKCPICHATPNTPGAIACPYLQEKLCH